MLTNRNVWNMLPATARDWGFGDASVNLVALPNFHVGGVGWALVGLYAGAAVGGAPRVRRRCRARRDLRTPGHPRRAGARRAAGPVGRGAPRRLRCQLVGGGGVRRLADRRERARRRDAHALVRLHPGVRPDRDGRRRDPPARRRPRPGGDPPRSAAFGGPTDGRCGGACRRADERRRRADRRGRRDLDADAAGDARLLEPARGDAPGDHSRRMAAQRRRRLCRRRRLRVPQRPRQGHDRVRGREHLPGRAGERAHGPPRGRRGRRDRRPVRTLG